MNDLEHNNDKEIALIKQWQINMIEFMKEIKSENREIKCMISAQSKKQQEDFELFREQLSEDIKESLAWKANKWVETLIRSVGAFIWITLLGWFCFYIWEVVKFIINNQ